MKFPLLFAVLAFSTTSLYAQNRNDEDKLDYGDYDAWEGDFSFGEEDVDFPNDPTLYGFTAEFPSPKWKKPSGFMVNLELATMSGQGEELAYYVIEDSDLAEEDELAEFIVTAYHKDRVWGVDFTLAGVLDQHATNLPGDCSDVTDVTVDGRTGLFQKCYVDLGGTVYTYDYHALQSGDYILIFEFSYIHPHEKAVLDGILASLKWTQD